MDEGREDVYAAPAGGRLPLRGRWQGEALTDEGRHPCWYQPGPAEWCRPITRVGGDAHIAPRPDGQDW